MSRVNNAYYMDPVWGDVSKNLADAIGGQPMRQAQAENLLTQTRSQQQQDAFSRADRRHRYGAADAFEQGDNMTGMTNLMRGDRIENIGHANMAFGGEQLAQDQATPDQQRARMSGAGIQTGADLTLTDGRADQLRLEDHQRGLNRDLQVQGLQNQGALAQTQAGLANDRWMTQFAHQNPTGLEHALVNEMSQGRMDPRDVQARTSPMSTDQTIADAHASGNPELANAIAASRYGEGPNAWTAGGGGGDGSGRAPQRDWEDIQGAQDAVHSVVHQIYGEGERNDVGNITNEGMNLPPEDLDRINEAAMQIIQDSGYQIAADQAVREAVNRLGGVSEEVDERWILPDRRSNVLGGPQQQPQQSEPGSQSRPEPGAMSQPVGPLTMPGPGGRRITLEEIQATAENRGISPQEVYEALLERGAVPDS